MKSKRLGSWMITFGQERVGQAWSCGELIPWTHCSGACEAAPVDSTTTWNINISFNNYKSMPSPSTRAHPCTHTHIHMHLHQCTMQIIRYCSVYPPFFSLHVYTGLLRRFTHTHIYIYIYVALNFSRTMKSILTCKYHMAWGAIKSAGKLCLFWEQLFYPCQLYRTHLSFL